MLLLSYLAYYHQAYHYWSPCFMGVPELSSIPLALVDFFKHFKDLRDGFFLSANEVARNLSVRSALFAG